MKTFLDGQRSCGILAHITSLPSPYGIGDIGPAALAFLDYLAAAGQRYWQILPVGPTNFYFDSSPYMSTSAFAGSPLLISPEALLDAGLIERSTLESGGEFSVYLTDYEAVSAYKNRLLKKAYETFTAAGPDAAYLKFCRETVWLENYALYMALRDALDNAAWFQWPRELATYEPSAIKEAKTTHREAVDYYRFEQYVFFSQWEIMKRHAEERNIELFGDIPIYLGLDSSDVWANQHLFELDEHSLQPQRVSGVPPDYFSTSGQRWGNPLYRWNSRDAKIRQDMLDWWVERFKAVFTRVHVARIDHFRGFESYWAVPASEETAENGRWIKGPGLPFFKKIEERLGKLHIIAEDLGEITAAVITLRDKCGFPGMKVLHFAFDGNPENTFLPYNYSNPACVVYTGTHDNNTTIGWFLSDALTDEQRQAIKNFANRDLRDGSDISRDLIYLALSSPASMAIIPLQDLLGFGGDCRMNTPSAPEGNWRWRCAERFLTPERAAWLKEMTVRFGRYQEPDQNERSKQLPPA